MFGYDKSRYVARVNCPMVFLTVVLNYLKQYNGPHIKCALEVYKDFVSQNIIKVVVVFENHIKVRYFKALQMLN